MSQFDADAALRAADRTIALLGATGYMHSQFPGAGLAWGDENEPPEPDDLDEIWIEPFEAGVGGRRYYAVTAVSGTYGAPERAYDWGQRVLAGTRDYLWFAIGRLRGHSQQLLADDLEREMLASRLIYLELTTSGESVDTLQVNARQYDISDQALVDGVLAAVDNQDWDRIEALRQPLGAGAAELLAAEYWRRPGWAEKALLARILYGARDHRQAGPRAVFQDLLGIPDSPPYDDTAREARTFALTWLDADDDPNSFVRLYEDEEAQAAGIARYRR